jgi:hypothetical protein
MASSERTIFGRYVVRFTDNVVMKTTQTRIYLDFCFQVVTITDKQISRIVMGRTVIGKDFLVFN